MGGRGGRESWTGEFGSIFPLPSLLNGRCNRCRRRSVTRCQTKSNPISPKNDTQKVVATVFTLIVTDFKNTQKLTNYLAHFGWKICHQDHPKMAQSSHTAETTSWSKQQISSVAWSSVKVSSHNKDALTTFCPHVLLSVPLPLGKQLSMLVTFHTTTFTYY